MTVSNYPDVFTEGQTLNIVHFQEKHFHTVRTRDAPQEGGQLPLELAYPMLYLGNQSLAREYIADPIICDEGEKP